MNSANIHPIDHISILVEYLLHPSNNSGALYQRVTTLFVYFASIYELTIIFLAKPKSANFTAPLLFIRILAILRSL